MDAIGGVVVRKCSGCKKILDEYTCDESQKLRRSPGFLQTNDGRAWHAECLVCSWCKSSLFDSANAESSKCYTRGGRLYCPRDYFRFSPMLSEVKLLPKSCLSCQQPIKPGDEVIHSPFHTFHSRCFSCDICGKDLLPGQPYTLLDGYPICLEDDLRIKRADLAGNHFHLAFSPASQSFFRRKRIRTSFNEQQQLSMQAFFAQNPNPNANELMSLSEETGLAKRVLQVWFQNARAKLRRTASGSEKTPTASSVDDYE